MPLRKIVNIDEEKCTGCGLCIPSCAEGALQIIDGKVRLVKEIYCDGLGACLGTCPEDAITVEERESEAFDEKATEEHLREMAAPEEEEMPCGCPGSMMKELKRPAAAVAAVPASTGPAPSELANWPVQLKLVPPMAPYFEGADLLLVADCVPFALADFHSKILRGKPVIVGCPKLDDPVYYVGKLADILKTSSINSLTVVHMEVPCCSGLTYIAEQALAASEKKIPMKDLTVSIEGEVIDEKQHAPV